MSTSASSKVWLITGCSSGFGRRLVNSVLARGDRVIATARTVENIKIEPSPRMHVVRLDVTAGFEAIKATVDEAAKFFGGIDHVVNNAGIGYPALLEEGGSVYLEKQFKTNVLGVMDVTNAALPHIRERGSGTVVIIGSRSAWRTEVPGIGFYSASKAAVHSIGETLSVELAQFNIKVLIVAPGAFRTEGIYGQTFLESNPIPAYDGVRTATGSKFKSGAGKEKGDPNKAMEAVVDVVRGEGKAKGRPWPLYLVLGNDAEAGIREKTGKLLMHLDEWSDVVRGVEFDE